LGLSLVLILNKIPDRMRARFSALTPAAITLLIF
jgi:hypothetical protein